MHAIVVHVTINDPDGAQEALEGRVVPLVSSSPGFVAGYWMTDGEGKGQSFAVFESEDAARAIAANIQAPSDAVTIDSVAVEQVVASG